MSGLYLVADDLTGALDSAASFSGRFGSIPVFLGAPHDEGSAHAAVDLATRDTCAQLAVRAMSAVAGRLAVADIAFKKIDSLLRGHWAVELAELLRTGHFSTCVLAPAFPSQGRITRQSRQIVRTDDSASYVVDIDPVAALRQLGLNVRCATSPGDAGASNRSGALPEVVVFDAATDAELSAIARWGAERNAPLLWCGSAGLARALAQHDPPRVAEVRRPLLAIVGTNHSVSQFQVARVTATTPTRCVLASADARETALRVASAIESTGTCLLTFEFARETQAPEAAHSIARGLHDLLPLTLRPSTLLVAGGETLSSVCRALGAKRLEVDAEFCAGVPHARLCGGLWDGVEVFSKSGAFGSPDLLDELLTLASQARPVGGSEI